MSKKKYKYWIYYLKSTNEIYAYTDNKDYAKSFENMRDMKMFIKVKKNLTKEEVNYLAREFQSNILKMYEYKTVNKNQTIVMVSIVSTMIENITVNSQSTRLICCDLYTYCEINPEFFNSKIKKALTVLGYCNLYEYVSETDSDLTKINIEVDELAIFIHNYGKSINERTK
jgi:hypothetical protein